MAGRTDGYHPTRIIWTSIRQPSSMMGFKIGTPVPSNKRRGTFATLADSISSAFNVGLDNLATVIQNAFRNSWGSIVRRESESGFPQFIQRCFPIPSSWNKISISISRLFIFDLVRYVGSRNQIEDDRSPTVASTIQNIGFDFRSCTSQVIPCSISTTRTEVRNTTLLNAHSSKGRSKSSRTGSSDDTYGSSSDTRRALRDDGTHM
jgi:hypothetical protein